MQQPEVWIERVYQSGDDSATPVAPGEPGKGL